MYPISGSAPALGVIHLTESSGCSRYVNSFLYIAASPMSGLASDIISAVENSEDAYSCIMIGKEAGVLVSSLQSMIK